MSSYMRKCIYKFHNVTNVKNLKKKNKKQKKCSGFLGSVFLCIVVGMNHLYVYVKES